MINQEIKKRTIKAGWFLNELPLDEKYIMLADVIQHRIERAEKMKSKLERGERYDKPRN